MTFDYRQMSQQGVDAATAVYIQDQLVPAAATLFARMMRVRSPGAGSAIASLYHPQAYLPFVSAYFNTTDPDQLSNALLTMLGDADYAATVMYQPVGVPGVACPPDAIAFSSNLFVEAATLRPVLGRVIFCELSGDLYHDLTSTLHELIHALVFMSPYPFAGYEPFGAAPGGSAAKAAVAATPDSRSTARLSIVTPQVVDTVRRHFACPNMLGAELEDDGTTGTVGAHWDARIYERDELDHGGPTAPTGLSYSIGRITDLSLALMQDSGWYDVKYGSMGWNSNGYHAGCAFATGTYAEAAADPAAARFLCAPDVPAAGEEVAVQCLPDLSGVGACASGVVNEAWDDFRLPVVACLGEYDADGTCPAVPLANGRDWSSNCLTLPGMRCQQPLSPALATKFFDPAVAGALGCVPMSCAADGSVLVDGAPCTGAPAGTCPDAGLLCGDPGLLTCAATLNDCFGHGDCLLGRCYCHVGWGGDDCSVAVCVGGCNDGSPCPASGFCGVPECGSWSEGADGRGMPCNADGALPVA